MRAHALLHYQLFLFIRLFLYEQQLNKYSSLYYTGNVVSRRTHKPLLLTNTPTRANERKMKNNNNNTTQGATGWAAASSFAVRSPVTGPPPQVLPTRHQQVQDVVVHGHGTGHHEVPARGRPVPRIQQPEEQADHVPRVTTDL